MLWRSLRLPNPPRPPHVENRRIDQQFHQRRGDDAADHRRGDAFHHGRARAVPENAVAESVAKV